MVGDCVGHGLDAATVMGQLRSACRALLLQDASAAQTLTAMDRFAALIPGAICSTVFCGTLRPGRGPADLQQRRPSAGHPGPARRTYPAAETAARSRSRSRPGIERTEASCTVPARATLLLYTDGLVERRRRCMDTGIARLGRRSSGRLRGRGGRRDRHHDRHGPGWRLRRRRRAGSLPPPRPAGGDFPGGRPARTGPGHAPVLAEPLRPRPQTMQDVLVAAGEACANAIEHGHRHAPGAQIRLRAAATVTRSG